MVNFKTYFCNVNTTLFEIVIRLHKIKMNVKFKLCVNISGAKSSDEENFLQI